MKVSASNNTKITGALLVFSLILLAIGYNIYSPPPSSVPVPPAVNPIIPQIIYQFNVYCQIDSPARLSQINQALGYSYNAIDVDLSAN